MTELVPFAVSILEAVRISGLGRSSIYKAIASGHLQVRKAGRRTIIEISALHDYITQLPVSKGRARDPD